MEAGPTQRGGAVRSRASRASAAGAGQAVKGPRGSLAAWWVVICVFVVGVSFSVFKVADYYDLALLLHHFYLWLWS